MNTTRPQTRISSKREDMKDEKEEYKCAEIEVILFEAGDVITRSNEMDPVPYI